MSGFCSVGALNALAAARAAGVIVTLQGGRLLLEAPDLPADVVALLKANKPELLRILAGREAAKAALNAAPPPDWAIFLPRDFASRPAAAPGQKSGAGASSSRSLEARGRNEVGSKWRRKRFRTRDLRKKRVPASRVSN